MSWCHLNFLFPGAIIDQSSNFFLHSSDFGANSYFPSNLNTIFKILKSRGQMTFLVSKSGSSPRLGSKIYFPDCKGNLRYLWLLTL